MALTTTTCSVAIAAADNSITVASATGFAADRHVLVNGEFMKVRKHYTSGLVIPVHRGLNGTSRQAHAVTSNVTVGADGADFSTGAAGNTKPYPNVRAREVRSYNAAGAIALPTPGNDMVAIINGTVARAMTLADPTKDMDGDILIVVGNGKAAHTITYTAGLGNGGAGLDVGTFDVGAQCADMFIAANGIWVPLPSPRAGTLTDCDITYA